MSARSELDEILHEFAQGGGPVVQTLVQMNSGTFDQMGLDEDTVLAARFGALVALDASPASYLVHLTLADQAGIKPDTVKALLATLAPLVGSTRVVSAADKLRQAIQMADRI
jgi:alkylhydroperoxidase/carboxymuconolactone decarboxylase family protein YurZ